MARLVYKFGNLLVSTKYLQIRKRDGSLWYCRRVPRDLLEHHGGKTFVREHLRTRSIPEAAKRISVLAKRDDSLWAAMRSSDGELAPRSLNTRRKRN
jgi:hypothetical protein